MAKPAPIKFKIKKKHLPFNPHLFFRVIQDVDSYPLFISNMPACHADLATKYENSHPESGIVKGGFSAPTRIGFNAVSFDYASKVTYTHPKLPVDFCGRRMKKKSLIWKVTTVSESSRIFNSLSSEWVIRVDPESPTDRCIVDYQIEMEFASALYSAVTSQFFDMLVSNVDD